MSSTEKAALLIAFDEIEKSRKRIDILIDSAITVEYIKDAVSGLPELQHAVREMHKSPRQVVLAKGKSHIDKKGHLILVYTDGTQEDLGDIKPSMIVRHAPHVVGGVGGLDSQQVQALIDAAIAALPAAASSGVESRYEIFPNERVTVTSGRNLLVVGGLFNGGALYNNGVIAHVAFA